MNAPKNNLRQWIGNMRLQIHIYISILIHLIASPVLATPNVYFAVRPEKGPQESDFLAQISVTGQNFANTGAPTFEETDEMTMTYASNTIQQQIINGAVSFQKTYIYKVEFKKILASGEYVLPHGSILVDGAKFRFPTKKIFIEAPSSAPQGSSTNPSNRNLLPKENGFQFVQTVSNEKPFIGEQILYKVEIIAPENLERAQLEEFEPQGVWRERYGAEEKQIRRVQNISVNSFSESWFPIQAGTIEVPERTLRAEVKEFQKKVRPNYNLGSSLGDQLLGNLLPYLTQFKTVEKNLTAQTLKLEVQPLPAPPTPIKGFIPVGHLKVTNSLSSESANIGEPITLTIQVSGDANLRPLELFNPPTLNTQEFKRYDDKPILSRTIGASNVTFYKTFKVSLIPLKSGFHKLPSFEINWFNPTKKSYENFATEPFSILVQGEDLPQALSTTPKIDEKKQTNATDKQIENYSVESFNKKVPYLARTTSLKVSLTSLLLLILGAFFNFLKRMSSNRETSTKANLNKLLLQVNSATNNSKELESLISEFKNYLSFNYKFDITALTPTEIEHSLSKKLDTKIATDIKLILTQYESLSFSGASHDSSDLILNLKELIIRLK